MTREDLKLEMRLKENFWFLIFFFSFLMTVANCSTSLGSGVCGRLFSSERL